MPAELNRILRTIRDLDERSEDLAAQIQENFEAAVARPPGKAGAEGAAALRARVAADQALLCQWAEEKVQLALAGHELLDVQEAGLATDVAALSAELAEAGQLADDGFPYDEGELGGAPEAAPRRGGRQGGASYGGGYDAGPGLDAAPSLEPRAGPRRTTVTLSLSRQQSEFGSEDYGAGGEAGLGAWGAGGDAARRGTARQRAAAAAAQQQQAAAAAAAADGGGAPRRRAASAAAHATAAAVAAMDEDDDGYGDAGEEAPPPAYEAAPVAAGAPLIEGLAEASAQLQAPGRPLEPAEIGPALVGRVAEMWWPEEGRWFLMQVQGVDAAKREVTLYYQTGEIETLSYEQLAQVASEQHVSLVLEDGR
jgi:hypothetical protein